MSTQGFTNGSSYYFSIFKRVARQACQHQLYFTPSTFSIKDSTFPLQDIKTPTKAYSNGRVPSNMVLVVDSKDSDKYRPPSSPAKARLRQSAAVV